MRARIFQQPKTAMQSGTAGTTQWALEWEPAERRLQDPLMGWFGSGDTQAQVHLHFDTREEAIAYADRVGIPYDVELPPIRVHTPKVYADNFKFDRLENWTH
jgi:hypothetical protein